MRYALRMRTKNCEPDLRKTYFRTHLSFKGEGIVAQDLFAIDGDPHSDLTLCMCTRSTLRAISFCKLVFINKLI